MSREFRDFVLRGAARPVSLAYRTLVLQQKARGRSRGPRPPAKRVVMHRGAVFTVGAPKPIRNSHRGASGDLLSAAKFGRPRTWSRRRRRIPKNWPTAFR